MGIKCLEETKRKIGEKNKKSLKKYYDESGNHPANYIEREFRLCECGCGLKFECKINSKRKYFTAWHRK